MQILNEARSIELEIGLKSLKLARGNERDLKFLIDGDRNKFADFMDNFWLGKNMQATSLCNYRLYRLQERNMTIREFLSMYYNNPIQALENLFLHPVHQEDVDELERQIVAEKLSLERLYYLHNNKPLKKLQYFILGRV